MKKVQILLVILVALMVSCSKDDIKVDPDNLILGVWNYSSYQDNTMIFTRNIKFTDNQAYKFIDDGTVIERQNAGFCGTPPITYTDNTGTWTIINDNLIRIKVPYWGGTLNYRLEIVSLDETTLKVIYFPAE